MPSKWKWACTILTLCVSAAAAQSAGAGGTDGPELLPLKEFMGHVMQRNAVQLWSWTTYLSDEKGDRYTRPNTDIEWEDAESDALTLGQLARSLQAPERRLDDQWDGFAAGLAAAADKSADAAERHDFDGMLKAAGEIDARCVACHLHYVPDLEGASAPPGASR